MGVHVPQAGQKSLALGVNDLERRVGADGDRSLNSGDPIVSDEDVSIPENLARLGVEHVGMEEENSVGMMGEFGSQRGSTRVLDFILRGQERLDRGFPALGNNGSPVID